MPTASMKNTTVLMIALALGACGGDGSTEGTSNDTSDSDSDSNGSNSNSGTVSVTLGTTMSASESGSESSTVSTTVEPTETTEPTTTDATVNPDTGSTDSESTGDSSGSDSSTTETVDDDTIYEIQMETIPVDTDVIVNGVVVTAKRDPADNQDRFWAEEPGGGEYSGIVVFAGMMGDELGIADLQIGDVVDITGTVAEFNDLTEIDISGAAATLVVVDTGQDLAPDVVDISVFNANLTAEPWESTLVRIEGSFTVTMDGVTAFAEYTVTDGTDDVVVDNFCYDSTAGDFPGLGMPGSGGGATFDAIQGPVNWFNDTWKIMPRAETDLEGYVAP